MDDDAELAHILARTGHDVHFLSRLERVTLDQTELALRLYRDPALVRDLLGDPACPAGERVAIAIAGGTDPPHIIVARDGAFVTCLGSKMLPLATPVLPWQRVEIHLGRTDLARARAARADELLEDRGARRLLDRVLHDGAGLSREHFAQLAVVEPVLQSHFMKELLETLPTVLRVGGGIARSRGARRNEELLQQFWTLYFGACHLVLLACLGGWRSFEFFMRPEVRGQVDLFSRFSRVARLGGAPLALRLLWAIGRGGKHALPSLKAELAAARDITAWIFPALGLSNVGLQHRRLHAEVQGALGPTRLPPDVRDNPHAAGMISALRGLLDNSRLGSEDDSEREEQYARVYATQAYLTLSGRPDDDPLAGVLAPLLPTVCANVVYEHGSPQAMVATMMQSAALAQSPAERFYFPAELAPQLAPRYSPESALLLARSIGGEAAPVRAAERVGRNDPCPCKSGRKYKKCCGVAA